MNIFNELNNNYNIDKIEDFQNLRFKTIQTNILNQLQYNFKWISNDESIIIPRNFEILNRIFGITGFMKEARKFVRLSPVTYDDDNNINEYVALGFGTSPKSYGNVNKDEVIPCFNNPLGLPDILDINYFAYQKSQNDISRMYQLINSRLIPILKTDSDQARNSALKIFDNLRAGRPAIFTTTLMDEISKIDILDPNNITKMECLTSYDEILDKNIANRFGASLDIKDKKAQVNNAELKAYDDITTTNYLVNYEPRLEFVKNMKEAGFNIDVIVSPIFADEPTEDEIEDPELLNDEENLRENEENLQEDEEKGDKEDE